jgi:UDP-galactopyranose mutase
MMVGEENIVDIFFRPYTKKMWGIDIEELDPSILERVPVRDDLNDLYFPEDEFQALPEEGYTKLIENILNHPLIEIKLNTPFQKDMAQEYVHTFNSMAIDEYFDYELGELPYRSIKFHDFHIPVTRIFPVATVNFTHDAPYTRVTEWKNLPAHGESDIFTTLTVEEPCDYKANRMERFYPIKDISGKNIQLYKKYKAMSPQNMTFIGRCGTYVYLDMHQAVSSALAIASRFK